MILIWCRICGNLYYLPNAKLPVMRQLPLLFLLLLSTSAFSQSINLHTSPSTALDMAPRWRIGVEYDTQMEWAFSLDVGYGNDALQVKATDRRRWDNEYYYLEFRPEIKLFLTSFKRNPNFRKHIRQRLGQYPHSNSSGYISLEYFHSHLKNTFYNSSIEISRDTRILFDEGTFHKIKNGGHFKIGVKHRDGRFIMDFSTGIGGTQRHKFYTEIKNSMTYTPFYDYDDNKLFPVDDYRKVGVNSLVHFTLNLRLGYMIWRK